MDLANKSYRDSSNGELDSSLLKLIQDISDDEGGQMVNQYKSIDWGDQGLLSDSDTETGAALKVTAQSVGKLEVCAGTNFLTESKAKKLGRQIPIGSSHCRQCSFCLECDRKSTNM